MLFNQQEIPGFLQHSMKENKEEISFMEKKERDIFAEARAFLKARHLEKHGIIAEGIRAVKNESLKENEVNS